LGRQETTRAVVDGDCAGCPAATGLADQAQAAHPEQAEAITAAAALLQRLIAQDVEEKPEGGCQIKPGTEKDRMVSVPDPEMRHGRKSASKRFNGHKAAVAVDLESQLIGAVEVLAGNAGDQRKRWSWCTKASG